MEAFETLKTMEEEVIGIPYISDPTIIYTLKTLMSNSIYHCNNRGEKERTRQLINDLYNAGAIDVKNIEEYHQIKDKQNTF